MYDFAVTTEVTLQSECRWKRVRCGVVVVVKVGDLWRCECDRAMRWLTKNEAKENFNYKLRVAETSSPFLAFRLPDPNSGEGSCRAFLCFTNPPFRYD